MNRITFSVNYRTLFISLFTAACFGLSAPAYAGDWLEGANGYARGLDQSAASGKPLVLYFYTDWCPYCRKFEKHTLADGGVKKVLDGFVLVRINPEDGSRENQIAQQYRVDGYPAVFFSNPATGQSTQEVTQAVRSADDFKKAAAEFLKVVVPKKQAAAAQTPSVSTSQDKAVASALPADHILHLKNGRKVEGRLISQDAKGVKIEMDELGEVYFSILEISKLEEIKK